MAAAKVIIPQKNGSIVNISSTAGLAGSPRMAHHGAAKAGVINFTRTCTIEWAKHNINVNCIAPGMVETEGVRAQQVLTGKVDTSLPALRRHGFIEDISNMALFLASEEANHISGKIINIASGNGIRGQRNDYMYGTAKAGVINLTRVLAMTFSTYNIQINCIAPGYVDVRDLQPEPATGESNRTAKFIPVGRLGVPNDIGHLGLFLASDASASITGGLFANDGGGLAGGVAPTGYAPVIDLKED